MGGLIDLYSFQKSLSIARKDDPFYFFLFSFHLGGWRGRRFQAREEAKGIPSLLRFRCASTSKKMRTLKRKRRARQRQLSSTLIPHDLPQATRTPRQFCLIIILCLLFLFSPLPLILTGWDMSESCLVLRSQQKSETIFDMMILIWSFLSSLPPVPIASTLIKANKVCLLCNICLILQPIFMHFNNLNEKSQVPKKLIHFQASLVILAFSTHSLFEGMAIGKKN